MSEFRPSEAMSDDIIAPAAIEANNDVDGKQPIEQGPVEADPTLRKLLISEYYCSGSTLVADMATVSDADASYTCLSCIMTCTRPGTEPMPTTRYPILTWRS